MPISKAGKAANDPVRPVCVALPVVCSTNQGRATRVSSLPISEIVLPMSSARIGTRVRRAATLSGSSTADAEQIVRVARHEHVEVRGTVPALEAEHQHMWAIAFDFSLGQNVDPSVLLPEPSSGRQAQGQMRQSRARGHATAVTPHRNTTRVAQ